MLLPVPTLTRSNSAFSIVMPSQVTALSSIHAAIESSSPKTSLGSWPYFVAFCHRFHIVLLLVTKSDQEFCWPHRQSENPTLLCKRQVFHFCVVCNTSLHNKLHSVQHGQCFRCIATLLSDEVTQFTV